MQTLDIADIAQRIDTPYHPVPLASTGGVEVSAVICAGPKAWHRSSSHDELALVLEGVVQIEGPTGRVIVNEGDMVRVPARIGHAFSSGMRSTMVLFRQKDLPVEVNGHRPEPVFDDDQLESPTRVSFGTDVRRATAFEWLQTGEVGGFGTHSTRLRGRSAPYEAADGAVVLLVYRGVVEVTGEGAGVPDVDDEAAPGAERTADGGETEGAEPAGGREAAEGGEPASRATVVGSQLLVLPAGARVTLESPRGATVVVLARQGAGLPKAG